MLYFTREEQRNRFKRWLKLREGIESIPIILLVCFPLFLMPGLLIVALFPFLDPFPSLAVIMGPLTLPLILYLLGTFFITNTCPVCYSRKYKFIREKTHNVEIPVMPNYLAEIRFKNVKTHWDEVRCLRCGYEYQRYSAKNEM